MASQQSVDDMLRAERLLEQWSDQKNPFVWPRSKPLWALRPLGKRVDSVVLLVGALVPPVHTGFPPTLVTDGLLCLAVGPHLRLRL